MKIAEIYNISKDEIVTVKGKLVSISGVKKVLFREEGCNKKEGMIVDPPDNIQIVLWGGLCEKDLNVGKTYIFKNVRYRVTNYGHYINSPKNLECNVKESDDVKENVAEIKLPSTLIEDNLTFMAIQKCSKSIICCKCSTKKEIIEAETFVKCTKCNTLNKGKVCRKALYARIV